MKTAFILLSLSLLVACSPAEERNMPRDSEGRLELVPAEVCLNGVVYYRFRNAYGPSYAPKLNPDSTVETCN